jgi:cytochrome c oxidase subunit 2
MHIHKYERLWLMIGSTLLIVFLVILAIQTLVFKSAPPSHQEMIDPQKVHTTPPFDNPGVVQVGENEYEATIISLAFGYTPDEIVIPRGSKVNFTVTSTDVLHGFQVPNTTINTMIVPGQISKFSYVFDKPGEYLNICNEYCGAGHQVMMSKIIVE